MNTILALSAGCLAKYQEALISVEAVGMNPELAQNLRAVHQETVKQRLACRANMAQANTSFELLKRMHTYSSSADSMQKYLQGLEGLYTSEEGEDIQTLMVSRISRDTVQVDISGMLVDGYSWINPYRGLCSYQEIAVALVSAYREAENIVVNWSSPGGQVTPWLTRIVSLMQELNSKSNVTSVVSGTCLASAAYWIASQSSNIYTEKLASVGSIGCMVPYTEKKRTSQTDIQAGWSSQTAVDSEIKDTIFRSGSLKGKPNNVEPLDSDSVGILNSLITEINSEFQRDVLRSRPQLAKTIQDWSQGGDYFGSTALELGLVDKVVSVNEYIDGLKDAA